MFEQFSSGYYVGEVYIEPGKGDRGAIQTVAHERLNKQLYVGDEGEKGLSRLDAPLVMKIEGTHFPVVASEDTPAGTLELPPEYTDKRLPTRSAVFLAKGDRAVDLLRYSGWDLASGA
jgi:hypothetical protein